MLYMAVPQQKSAMRLFSIASSSNYTVNANASKFYIKDGKQISCDIRGRHILLEVNFRIGKLLNLT
jgi:hypothetical protein